MTPGSTRAVRCFGFSSMIRFSRLSAITIPSSTGIAAPERLVPLPRETKGTLYRAQVWTVVITSSCVLGMTTALGVTANAVNPSDS